MSRNIVKADCLLSLTFKIMEVFTENEESFKQYYPHLHKIITENENDKHYHLYDFLKTMNGNDEKIDIEEKKEYIDIILNKINYHFPDIQTIKYFDCYNCNLPDNNKKSDIGKELSNFAIVIMSKYVSKLPAYKKARWGL